MASIPERIAARDHPPRRSDWFTLLTYHLKVRNWNDYSSFDFSFSTSPSKPARVLVIQLSSIGDVTYTLPALNALRRRFPGAEINLLTEESCCVGAVDHSALDKIWKLPAEKWIRRVENENQKEFRKELREIIHRMNGADFDFLINLHFSPLAAILAHLISAEKRSGLFLNDNLQPVLEGNPFHTLRFLGLTPGNDRLPVSPVARHCLGVDSFYDQIEFYRRQTPKIKTRVQDLYSKFHNQNLPHVLINTGSRMKKRRWPVDHCRQVVNRMLDNKLEIGLIGGPDDVERLDKIADKFSADRPLVKWYKKTNSLVEDIHLADLVDLTVTTDSGPQHLISIRNNPCLVLAGDIWVGPWNNRSYLLQATDRQISSIPPAQVIQAANNLKAGESFTGRDNVVAYEGRPERQSIWYRLFPVEEEQPSPVDFRKWLLGMIILDLWGAEAKKYGWRGAEISPERLLEIYEMYWTKSPPELVEPVDTSEITGLKLLSASVSRAEKKITRFTEVME